MDVCAQFVCPIPMEGRGECVSLGNGAIASCQTVVSHHADAGTGARSSAEQPTSQCSSLLSPRSPGLHSHPNLLTQQVQLCFPRVKGILFPDASLPAVSTTCTQLQSKDNKCEITEINHVEVKTVGCSEQPGEMNHLFVHHSHTVFYMLVYWLSWHLCSRNHHFI